MKGAEDPAWFNFRFTSDVDGPERILVPAFVHGDSASGLKPSFEVQAGDLIGVLSGDPLPSNIDFNLIVGLSVAGRSDLETIRELLG